VNYIDDAMYLFDGGVFSSESKLVFWYCVDCKMGCIQVIKSFSKPLERIGSRLMGL